MKGKIITLVMIVSLMITALSCAAPATTPTQPTTPAQAPVIKIDFGNFYAGGDVQEACQLIMKYLGEASDGRFEFKYLPAATVAAVDEHPKAVGQGLFDLYYMYEGYYRKEIPVYGLFSVPPLLRSPADVWKLCKLGGWDDLAKKVDAKKNIAFIGRRGKVSATLISRVPIPSIKDVKGLKMRSDGINAEALATLGAQVVFIEAAEVYTSLSSNLIDATDFDSVTSSYDAGFQEVTKYWIQPALTATNSHCFVANMDFWNSLSEADKTLINITFSEIVAEMIYSAEFRTQQVLAKIQAENGITVQYWSDDDVKQWKVALMKVLPRYEDDADWLEGWQLMEDYCKQVGY